MGHSRDGSPGFDGILASGTPGAIGWPRLDLEGMNEIMFTSGTTAAPKAAVRTHGRTAASAHIYRGFLGPGPTAVMHSFFPIFTTARTKCAAFAILSAGGTFVLDPELKMPEVIARMAREKSTIYYGVPALHVFVLGYVSANPGDLPLSAALRRWRRGYAPKRHRRAPGAVSSRRHPARPTPAGQGRCCFRNLQHRNPAQSVARWITQRSD